MALPSPLPTATAFRVQVVSPTPAPPHGTHASPAAYAQQWLAFWIVLALLVGGALGSATTWLIAERERSSKFRIASGIGFFVGLLGATGHVVFVDLRGDERFVPIFDETTLLWGAVAVVSLLVPFVSEFSFGGASFKLAETQKQAEDVVEQVAQLTENWTRQIAQLLAELESEIAGDDFVDVLRAFYEMRAYEALEFLGADGEKRRLSLWLYDDRTDELSIYFSDGIDDDETKNARVKRGEGIVGTVFALQQTWNERDAPALPVWIPLGTRRPRYHGIFLVPVNFADLRLGVLCVDRRKRETFARSEVDVMTALATIYGMALGNEKAQQLLLGLGRETD